MNSIAMSQARKELLITIEQQQDKINKYEAKIKDIVIAYKSLAKEKQALQASLNALSTENISQPKDGDATEDEAVGDQCDASSEASFESKSSADVNQLDSNNSSKILALTASLQTLTAEKNRVETSLKEDRKRMIEERKKIEDQLKSELAEFTKQKKEYEVKLQELKSKVIVIQTERENDSQNAMLMLREVESRLSKERREREKLERRIEESTDQNRRLTVAVGSKNQEKKQQKQISDLQNELEQVRCRLKNAEEQCKEPPVLKRLQEQMEDMKKQYTHAIYQEKLRAEASEKSARELSQLHEDRVVALEASLTELSQTAASYDRTKQTHLQTIDSLREKVAQLSEENDSLNQSKCSSDSSFPSSFQSINEDLDLNSLVQIFQSIWKKIKTKQKYETELHIEELLVDDAVLHQKCLNSYEQLKNEMEELRKESSQKQNVGNKECHCGMKQLVSDLKERVRTLTADSYSSQTTHNQQVNALKQELRNLKLVQEQKTSNTDHDQRVTVSNLEQQLSDHCQRSLATLQDRDQEIHRLTKEILRLNQEAKVQPSTVAAALLSQVSSGGSEGPLLHHFEELARKELEARSLRKHKIQLEKSMREIQMNSIDKQQFMQDQIDLLEEQVERLKRNNSREGENLEYLKNVVLQYMTSSDKDSKFVILNAIAAVLKFTPGETESVRKCLSLWWWQQPNPSKSSSTHRVRSPSVSSYLESSSSPGGYRNSSSSSYKAMK